MMSTLNLSGSTFSSKRLRVAEEVGRERGGGTGVVGLGELLHVGLGSKGMRRTHRG